MGSSPLPETLSFSEPPSQSPFSFSSASLLWESFPSPDSSTEWAGTLTPGHLDELGDTEHTRGDETLLEIRGVWNREKMGLTGSLSFLDTLGYPHSRDWSGHPVHPLQPCGKMEVQARPGSDLGSAAQI